MPELHKLTARRVATEIEPGRYGDGGGLYLVVSESGAKRWVFRYRRGDTRPEMGLGGVTSVTLKAAREAAGEARSALAAGHDPIRERRRMIAENKAEGMTFGAFADQYVSELEGTFKSEKHLAQWKRSAKELAAPLRPLSLAEISTEDVLACLKPHWKARPETARRFQGRVERILDAAYAKGLRTGENPARWRGHISTLLPARKAQSRGHYTAMPYKDVPAFMKRLKAEKALNARLLEFVILTACRTGEAREAQWDEIDFTEKLWRIPKARTKTGRGLEVPLAPRAVEILTELKDARISKFIFPGQKHGKPLSHVACQKMLAKLEVSATAHGFRSSFRDWAGDMTAAPREIAEAALGHAAGDRTEQAYRRGDALERRRELMTAWDQYLNAPAGRNVVIFTTKQTV